MKKSIFLFLLVISWLLIYSCASVQINPQPELIFTIVTWEQSYNDLFEEYSIVEIYYRVENTGLVEVDYIEVFFEAICTDGTSFIEKSNGLGIRPGEKYNEEAYIDTAGLEVESVQIVDQYLKRY